MTYFDAKWLHVLFSTLIFGTGIGSAFYLFVSSLQRDARVVAGVARIVVWADWLFTATMVVLQPLTGWWMISLSGLPWSTPWIAWSVGLYIFAIVCWLPVMVMQMRMRDLATEAASQGGAPLPAAYWRLFRFWVALGVPAFFAFVVIFYLMVVKPVQVF